MFTAFKIAITTALIMGKINLESIYTEYYFIRQTVIKSAFVTDDKADLPLSAALLSFANPHSARIQLFPVRHTYTRASECGWKNSTPPLTVHFPCLITNPGRALVLCRHHSTFLNRGSLRLLGACFSLSAPTSNIISPSLRLS